MFILSDYLDKQSKVNEHSCKISKLGLKEKNPIDIQQKNREIVIDIDFLFEDNDNINIQYRSERGSRGLDSFYGYQLIQLYFVLEIESKLGIQINDEIWEQIETVGALLQAIKDHEEKI